ncbi:MAG TPA: DUF1772 domain-containing protein [Pseudonocardia sp.]|nr:DUF1772 domain-containing protein [Pseudonocardia sp.]
MRTFTSVLLVVLMAAASISFGALVGETFMFYPNIFHDPPGSLALAREFMAVASPSTFFPPLGFTIIVTGALAVLLTWRYPRIRWYVAGAAAAYLGFELLLSVVYFWPRNTIMFVDPVGTHSVEFLRQTAAEFEAMHWVRVAGGALTVALLFTAVLRWFRAPAAAPAPAGALR